MPKLSETAVPAYRRHKASGQAIVTLDGQDFYLGPWESAASKSEYSRLPGGPAVDDGEAPFAPATLAARAQLASRIGCSLSDLTDGTRPAADHVRAIFAGALNRFLDEADPFELLDKAERLELEEALRRSGRAEESPEWLKTLRRGAFQMVAEIPTDPQEAAETEPQEMAERVDSIAVGWSGA